MHPVVVGALLQKDSGGARASLGKLTKRTRWKAETADP